MRGIFVSLVKRTCNCPDGLLILLNTEASIFKSMCMCQLPQVRHLYCTLWSLEMLNYCFAFQKEICSFKVPLIQHLKIKPLRITSRIWSIRPSLRNKLILIIFGTKRIGIKYL